MKSSFAIADEALEKSRFSVPGWAVAGLFILVMAVAGPVIGSVARPIFILGCGAIGYYAWQQSAAIHLQTMLVLLCFASLVRRLVDLPVGYDQQGLMLVGPLLAMMAPATELLGALNGKPFANKQIFPILIVGACTLYASLLSLFQGDFTNAASGAIKSVAPLTYAACLLQRAESPAKMVEAAASAFMVILPLMGLYGILQYVDPPDWDRYWMKNASILSAGLPVPFGVRTYSVMNGPASFATFTAAGLVLVLFLRSSLLALAVTAPAAIAFLLSMYRTAWLSMALAIAFCLLFSATRKRAATAILSSIAMVFVAMLTPFGDVISDRLASLTQGSNDGSARERLDQFISLWNLPDSGLFGSGFSTVDVGSAGTMAVDGMFITCWISMGIVVGLICLAALVWACVVAMKCSWSNTQITSVLVGALAAGSLFQMPLANIITGELGFLFWTFIVLISTREEPETGLAW